MKQGYSVEGSGSIHVGTLPGRRSHAVYVVRGGEITGIAYCVSEDAADEIARMLRVLANKYGVNLDPSPSQEEADDD